MKREDNNVKALLKSKVFPINLTKSQDLLTYPAVVNGRKEFNLHKVSNF